MLRGFYPMKRTSTPTGDLDMREQQPKRNRLETKQPPSLVIEVTSAPLQATEADFLEVFRHFGSIAYVYIAIGSGVALVEYEDFASAESCMNFARYNDIRVINQVVTISYSTVAQIVRVGLESREPTKVLVVVVKKAVYPLNLPVVYAVTKGCGNVLRIAITHDPSEQFLVEYDSVESAKHAKHTLNGADIYNDCCTLKAEFARLAYIDVNQNNALQWDFTKDALPSIPATSASTPTSGQRRSSTLGGLLPTPTMMPPPAPQHYDSGVLSHQVVERQSRYTVDRGTNFQNFTRELEDHGNIPEGGGGGAYGFDGSFGGGGQRYETRRFNDANNYSNPSASYFFDSTAQYNSSAFVGQHNFNADVFRNPNGGGGGAGAARLGAGGIPASFFDYRVNYNSSSNNNGQPSPFEIDRRATYGGGQTRDRGGFSRGRGEFARSRWDDRKSDGGERKNEDTSVLVVMGVNRQMVNCDGLFNLFCMYGNVMKVLFLQKIPDAAMVEMGTPAQASMAVWKLNNLRIFGNNLKLEKSRHLSIRQNSRRSLLPDGTSTYADYEGCRNQRYKTVVETAKNRGFAPTRFLHFFNAPPEIAREELASKLQTLAGVSPLSVKMFKQTSRNSISGVCEFANISDAAEVLMKCNHMTWELPRVRNPYTIKLSFYAGGNVRIRKDSSFERTDNETYQSKDKEWRSDDEKKEKRRSRDERSRDKDRSRSRDDKDKEKKERKKEEKKERG